MQLLLISELVGCSCQILKAFIGSWLVLALPTGGSGEGQCHLQSLVTVQRRCAVSVPSLSDSHCSLVTFREDLSVHACVQHLAAAVSSPPGQRSGEFR